MHTRLLSCDWGTSSFRLRLVDARSAQVIAVSAATQGIAAVHASWQQQGSPEQERIRFYLSVIQEHIKKIEQDMRTGAGGLPVILSGMASSGIGMVELPYTPMPFLLNGKDLQYKKIEKTAVFGHDLLIISGTRTANDVMRGEETQLIGCADSASSGKHVFIFTGTHSKHITTAGGKAIDMATYMTGEFFGLLSEKSILSNSVTAGTSIEEDKNEFAFEKGVADSIGEHLLHSSFMVRTNQLFKRFSKTENYFYLSGLLVGTELGELIKSDAEGIVIVGDKKLAGNYLLALKILGIDTPVRMVDATIATVQGQLLMYRMAYG